MTKQPTPVEEEIPAEEDVYYYTELSTRNIYEVKFFDGFVLARQPHPEEFRGIRKIDIKTFGREFDLYAGDQSMVGEAVAAYVDMITVH